jgi:hypothetical protein
MTQKPPTRANKGSSVVRSLSNFKRLSGKIIIDRNIVAVASENIQLSVLLSQAQNGVKQISSFQKSLVTEALAEDCYADAAVT